MPFLNFLSLVCTLRTEQTQSGDMLHLIQMLLLSLSPLVTPIVSSFGPPSMIVNVHDNGRVQFECMAAGPPELTTQGLLREFESKDSFNKAEK